MKIDYLHPLSHNHFDSIILLNCNAVIDVFSLSDSDIITPVIIAAIMHIAITAIIIF